MPRRDDDHVDLTSIVPERDEVASYQRGRQPATPARGTEPLAEPGERSLAAPLAAVVAIVAVAWAAYLQWNLLTLRDQLVTAETNLQQVRQQLSSTGETLNQSSQEMQDKLKSLSGEVDKMFASASRKNKDMIEKQTAELRALGAGLQKQLAGTNKSVEKLSAVQSSVAELNTKLQALSDQVALQDTALKEQQNRLGAVEKNATSIQSLGTSLDAVVEQQGALERRIEENESWVQSINVFRRQVLQRLDALSGNPG